jgi:hypothetical protein
VRLNFHFFIYDRLSNFRLWDRFQSFLESENIPELQINFAKFNKIYVLISFFILSLILGYFDHTSFYQHLNAVPSDHTELDAITNTKITIRNGNIHTVNISISPIVKATAINLLSALRVDVCSLYFLINASYHESHSGNASFAAIVFYVVLPF